MFKSRREIAEVIRLYLEGLRESGIVVEQAYLYGSYLQGTADEWSDLDLVVVSSSWSGASIWERARVTGPVRMSVFDRTGVSVEAIVKTPEEIARCHPAGFLTDILKDAELVYQRAPAAA